LEIASIVSILQAKYLLLEKFGIGWLISHGNADGVENKVQHSKDLGVGEIAPLIGGRVGAQRCFHRDQG